MKVIVIGAGPSGMICSYFLSKNGHDVFLIEKNEKVGKKIYITGKGRCNVTNNCTKEEFFSNVISNPKFLYPAYSCFSSQDTMDFFESNGVKLITERGNRVFPLSYKAADIVEALYKAIKKEGVKICLNEMVASVKKINEKFIIKTNKSIYECDDVVIACGGLSYSHTGSSGDGYKLAKSLGHSIVEPVAGLTAFKIKEEIIPSLYKFTLKNVALRVKSNSFKKEEFGELTFYKEGIAGPIALTLSSLINRLDPNLIEVEIDFKPALSEEKLNERLLREIQNKENKTVHSILKTLLPFEIIEWFSKISKIDVSKSTNELRKEERIKILNSLKHFKLTYLGLDDIDHAVVTCGGINTKEINPKNLESKIVPGLYFTGEVIDVDAFTGGFNLQIAFSTGALVGKNLLNK